MARARRLTASFDRRLALIVAGGLVLRLLYALVVVKKRVLLGDAHEFDLLAHNLVHGHGYVDPFLLKQGIVHPTAFKPPGYPFALAAITALGGGGYVAHHVLTCLFGTVTVLLIGLIGRRVGGDRLGLAAAGIAAVYPMLIAFDGSLRSESLYAMLVTGAVWGALRVAERPSLPRGVVLGAFIGLAALTRTEALLLLVLLAVPLAWRQAGRLRAVAVAVLAAVVVIAPWTVRNITTFHHPVLISTNDGGVFLGANCHPAYYGPGIGFWFFQCFPPSSAGGGRQGYNEVVAANAQRRQGLRYARHHPARGVAVMGVRVLRTWDLFQPRRQAALASVLEGRPLRFEQAGIAVYLVLLVLAVGGAVSLRRRPRVLAVLLAPALLVTLSSAISYGFTRFRAGAEPMVVLLAAVALLALADRVRRAARRQHHVVAPAQHRAGRRGPGSRPPRGWGWGGRAGWARGGRRWGRSSAPRRAAGGCAAGPRSRAGRRGGRTGPRRGPGCWGGPRARRGAGRCSSPGRCAGGPRRSAGPVAPGAVRCATTAGSAGRRWGGRVRRGPRPRAAARRAAAAATPRTGGSPRRRG